MSDDLLEEATRALRDADDPSGEAAKFTRARVLASLRESRVRRRTRFVFAVPLLAAALAATAGATETGRALVTAALEALHLAPPRDEPPPPGKPAVKSQAKAAVTAPEAPAEQPIETAPEAIAPPEPASPPPVGEPAVPETLPAAAASNVAKPKTAASSVRAGASSGASASSPKSEPSSTATSAPSRDEEPPPPAAAPAAVDPSLDLYRTAHRLHFAEHDPARALPAWDAYLAAAPNGHFAVDARYNRALCLVRLGRKEAARTALEPFAAGRMGGYRAAEARELIDALE